MSVDIDLIRVDGGTQSRAAINAATVAEYAEQMADERTVFPPVIVYHDGRDYWLADGFHRLAAWRQIGRRDIPAEVRQGGQRDARLHSAQANSTHGLRRTNEDKRRAVLMLLEDAEWSQWSDREIARRCRVSHTFVAGLRCGLTGNVASEDRAYTTKHGTEAVMNIAQIGARSKAGQITESAQPSVAESKPAAQAAEGNRPDQTDQENSPAPEPIDTAEAKLRRELARLTTEGLIDEVIGLRAALAEERAKRRAAEAEAADLRDDLRAMGEGDDMGAKVTHLLEDVRRQKGRLAETQAKLARETRRANALERERDKLRAQVEGQIIPMDGAA